VPHNALAPKIFDSAQVASNVLDGMVEGCQVISHDHRYVYLNEVAATQGQITREQLLGKTMMECYPGIELTPMFSVLTRCLTERTHDRLENAFALPDGSTGYFELRFVPVVEGICILSLDITKQKQMTLALKRTEEQLRQAQKMEAVGRLAGGVAHDFNNLLSVIMSYGELIAMELAADDPIRPDLEQITAAGTRATELTRQLLTFSRQTILEPRVFELNEVLSRLDKLLQRILGEDIDLVSLPSATSGRIRADPGSIEQVIMNLVVNARDAMVKGGKLTIETSSVFLDDEYVKLHLGARPGPHVMLAVSDTGIGMDKDTVARIFEPFFTTKGPGKGTGLGLSIVFGIVQQSGGNVWVYSEPGKGTTFKIFLPQVEAPSDAPRSSLSAGPLRGTETVLLVEDDAQVRTLSQEILRRSGYTVIVAHDGIDALGKAKQFEGPIDLLLTDVVMPVMGGSELAERLSVVRPQMKVLCMSGYTPEGITRHDVLGRAVTFIQKPITPARLGAKIREVLDGPKGR